MPNPDSPSFIPEAALAEHARATPKERPMNKQELIAYQEWKQNIPAELRSLVEGKLLEKSVSVRTDDLPSVQAFYRGMQGLLDDPDMDVATLDIPEVVQKQLAALRRIPIGEEGETNLFAALGDPDIDFGVKANYIQSKLLPRLEFLRARERRQFAKAIEEHGSTQVTGEQDEEEYSPHRAPEQEKGEGMPSEAVATVAPFWGGLYMDNVYDLYDPVTLKWKKSPRRIHDLPDQQLDAQRARTYRSAVKDGHGAVKLPQGWGAGRESIKWVSGEPSTWNVRVDQDGVVRVRTDEEGVFPFEIEMAPSVDAIKLAEPVGKVEEIQDRFPDELMTATQEIMAAQIPISRKLRRVASIIHKQLEYDKDPQWEAVYKADPTRYFEAIWENKKAKCDEANTLLTRLLTKIGVHARFIGGHSVRTQSEAGEALLLESNRHAWSYGWDKDAREWVRLDATPAGDPNVDQEEQQEELGEGDYGEQEAEVMSEEEMEKRLAELEQEEQEAQKKREQQDPTEAYAREAGTTPEEARDVLGKIEALRKRYARVLQDAGRQWQTLVRENTRERIVDRGPVQMSKMDEIDPDELVSGYIEITAGEKDPLIGEREEIERKKEKWFGGYQVYIAADMSGSMGDMLAGLKKSEAQRDMVFLIVDSCMNAAVSARKKEHQLKAPMPVEVGVVVFGEETKFVLPPTGEWGHKEQIILYRALDQAAGGSTPDHQALALIENEVARSLAQQDEARKKKPVLRSHDWKIRRFVIATADGGSDSGRSVKQANDRLSQMGIPVDLFLIGSEDDNYLQRTAEATYQSVTPISNVGELAEKGLKKLTERIKEAYAHSRH